MLKFSLFLACLAFSIVPAFSQKLSIGVIGGVSFTSGFRNSIVIGTRSGLITYTQTSSDRNSYLVGPTIELSLPFHFSVEADAIYRPLEFKSSTSSVLSLPLKSPGNTVVTWQFPILAKYRLRAVEGTKVNPFLAIGPAFRSAGNLNDTSPSNHGIAADMGLDWHTWRLKVAPTLRYTRWAADSGKAYALAPSTRQDQFEFLVGLSL